MPSRAPCSSAFETRRAACTPGTRSCWRSRKTPFGGGGNTSGSHPRGGDSTRNWTCPDLPPVPAWSGRRNTHAPGGVKRWIGTQPVVGVSSWAAEGGTGRRPHARPTAAARSAKPAALTQYGNSSPLHPHNGNDDDPLPLRPEPRARSSPTGVEHARAASRHPKHRRRAAWLLYFAAALVVRSFLCLLATGSVAWR